jgi:hypothetical protein
LADSRPAETLDLVALLRSGDAPSEIRRFAARRLLPLDDHGQMQALLAVIDDSDAETAESARETFASLPPDDFCRLLINPID